MASRPGRAAAGTVVGTPLTVTEPTTVDPCCTVRVPRYDVPVTFQRDPPVSVTLTPLLTTCPAVLVTSPSWR